MTPAPIALFVYNRPWHTQQAVEALLANELASVSPLFVFSDAPRDASAMQAVADVRKFISNITGFESVTIIEREVNLGLASSIIEGVTSLCNQFGKVIVFEDDLVAAPFFLKYVNDGLNFYQDEERVASIAGYTYPVDQTPQKQTFFVRGTNCWGWATWKRAWDLFETDGATLLDQLRARSLCHEFDVQGSYGYTEMLRGQVAGRNNSWAVRWHASAFLKNMLTLLPAHSLIKNIGMDGTGVHCSRFDNDPFAVDLWMKPILVESIPLRVEPDIENSIFRFFRSIKRRRLWNFLLTKFISLRSRILAD